MENLKAGEMDYTAAAAGTSGASCSVSGDINALNCNPAGITGVNSPELNAGWGKLYSGLSDGSEISAGNISFVSPLYKILPGWAGVTWTQLNLAGGYTESAGRLVYSAPVYGGISAGASLKYLRKSYSRDEYTAADPLFSSGYSKSAFGSDIGSFYKTGNFSFSFVLENINRPNMALKGTDRAKIVNTVASSYSLKKSVIYGAFSNGGLEREFAVGGEHILSDSFLLRTGVLVGGNSLRSVSGGLGWNSGDFYLDYSFSLPLSGLSGDGGIHRLSFGLKFLNYSSVAIKKSSLAPERNYESEIKELKEGYAAKEVRLDEMEKQLESLKLSVSSAPTVSGAETDIRIKKLSLELENAGMEKKNLEKKIAELEKKLKPQTPAIKKNKNSSKVYKVEKGDTLRSVSEKKYGDPSRWKEIYSANKDKVGRAGDLEEGTLLVIP